MTGSVAKSAVIAAVFAIHPLQAEPVAWVTARKDLLGAFFGFAEVNRWARILEDRQNVERLIVRIEKLAEEAESERRKSRKK